MDRQKLLDDIRVLLSLRDRALEHERRALDSESRSDHIEAQVARLEDAALKIERRLIELDAADGTPAQEELFDAEREELRARLDQLREKSDGLRRAALETDVLDTAALAARAAGVPARLRSTLHALVVDLHADPTVPRAELRPFQSQLAELVRHRRAKLDEVLERVTDARDYVVSAVAMLDEIDASATEGPIALTLPYADTRRQATTRLEMARMAIRTARTTLDHVAHDWPELAPLAGRPDWGRLPFSELKALISPPDPVAALRAKPFSRQVAESRQMARALALWLEELREAVSTAPLPTG